VFTIQCENLAGKWEQISGATSIVVQGAGNPIEAITRQLYIVKVPQQDIFLHQAKGNEKRIGGPGKTFLIADDSENLYALSPDSNGVYMYKETSFNWVKIGGAAKEIYGGLLGLCAINLNNEAYFYHEVLKSNIWVKEWEKISDTVKMIAIGKNSVYKISLSNNEVYEYNFSQKTWTRIGGAAKEIYAGGNKLYATNPDNGDIWQYKNNKWNKIGSTAKMFAVCPRSGSLYRLTEEGVWYYQENNNKWFKIGGPARKIFVGGLVTNNNCPNKIYATNPQTEELWYYKVK
jgi:hypothetical protein